MKKFLMFDLMITPWIIRILYWISQTGIILTSIITFFRSPDPYRSYLQSGFERMFNGGPLSALLILIFGSLVSRLFYEVLMVLFKISENTSDLKEIMKHNKTENS